jgi:hypothetical protein
VRRDWDPVCPSIVFRTYWQFAAERQAAQLRRMAGLPAPWSDDPTIAGYRFTNAYRASDRVSQYLIRHVIYDGEQEPEELFFRVMLFKFFNRIGTWELLVRELGEVALTSYSFERYDAVMSPALERGERLFSAAYIMPSGQGQFGHPRKHRNFLCLLEAMIQAELPQRIQDAGSMEAAFGLLRSFPLMGDFLAYQFVVDLNYSTLTNFSEAEFVVPRWDRKVLSEQGWPPGQRDHPVNGIEAEARVRSPGPHLSGPWRQAATAG